jgi:hypothetical protein
VPPWTRRVHSRCEVPALPMHGLLVLSSPRAVLIMRFMAHPEFHRPGECAEPAAGHCRLFGSRSNDERVGTKCNGELEVDSTDTKRAQLPPDPSSALRIRQLFSTPSSMMFLASCPMMPSSIKRI